LRIVFAGTPDFAAVPLRAMVESGFSPLAVLTQPDRKAGRGLRLQASPVKQAAEQFGIAVHQPESLRPVAFQDWLAGLEPDLMVVVAYGLILPKSVLDVPRHGCWNIHASLLPRWRGAAPIQRAIEAGDSHSGVCIMQMDVGLDTGAVLARASTPMARDETGGSLHARLAQMGADTLLECLRQLESGTAPAAIPQPQEGISYAHKLDKAEGEIDWQEPAGQLERRIRAFNPWPVCWCDIAGERTRIWLASEVAGEKATRSIPDSRAGTLLTADANGLVVACGEGSLRLTQLQRPGGKHQSAREYLQGRSLASGLRLPSRPPAARSR
jgi:methionyl-tRNA formyltransferase